MRAILGMHTRFTRCSSLLAPALVGAAGLVLGACQGDAPTAVTSGDGSNAQVVAFPMAPGAGAAAAGATHQAIRTLPTVQIMNENLGRASARGALTQSPFDLTFVGGPVLKTATSRNLYVNCATTPQGCWGTVTLGPATFLRDLNVSSLIQIASQYLSEDAAGKFGNVTELSTTATFTNHTATMNDIFGILFSASTFLHASGYTNLFHVFLPKGTDMCMTPTNCYSPDVPKNFVFCAFHGSVDFGPNQHVVFTVEPYQFVGGCVLPAQTRVIDGTASTLSHEFFESLTDPDLDAWFNLLTGNEIGDLCFGFRIPQNVGRRTYTVQEEYSNASGGCTVGQF